MMKLGAEKGLLQGQSIFKSHALPTELSGLTQSIFKSQVAAGGGGRVAGCVINCAQFSDWLMVS